MSGGDGLPGGGGSTTTATMAGGLMDYSPAVTEAGWNFGGRDALLQNSGVGPALWSFCL